MVNLDTTKHPEVKGCSPARIAKWYEHARAGAHAVATLGDVENLMAEIKSLREELEEDVGVIKVWRRRLHDAEAERDEARERADRMRESIAATIARVERVCDEDREAAVAVAVEWWREERLRLLRLLHNASIQLADGSVIDADGLGWPDPSNATQATVSASKDRTIRNVIAEAAGFIRQIAQKNGETINFTMGTGFDPILFEVQNLVQVVRGQAPVSDSSASPCSAGHAYELRQTTGKQTCIRCYEEMPWPESHANDPPELQDFYSNFAFQILADSFLCTAAGRIFRRFAAAVTDSKLNTYNFVRKTNELP